MVKLRLTVARVHLEQQIMAIITVYIIIHLTDLISYKKDGIHKYLLASKRNIFRNINQIYVSFPGGVLDMMIPFEDGMALALA